MHYCGIELERKDRGGGAGSVGEDEEDEMR